MFGILAIEIQGRPFTRHVNSRAAAMICTGRARSGGHARPQGIPVTFFPVLQRMANSPRSTNVIASPTAFVPHGHLPSQ